MKRLTSTDNIKRERAARGKGLAPLLPGALSPVPGGVGPMTALTRFEPFVRRLEREDVYG